MHYQWLYCSKLHHYDCDAVQLVILLKSNHRTYTSRAVKTLPEIWPHLTLILNNFSIFLFVFIVSDLNLNGIKRLFPPWNTLVMKRLVRSIYNDQKLSITMTSPKMVIWGHKQWSSLPLIYLFIYHSSFTADVLFDIWHYLLNRGFILFTAVDIDLPWGKSGWSNYLRKTFHPGDIFPTEHRFLIWSNFVLRLNSDFTLGGIK